MIFLLLINKFSSTKCSSLLFFIVISLNLFSGLKCQQQPFGDGQFMANRLRNSIWSPAEIVPNLYNNQQAPYINETPIKVDLDLYIQSIRPTSDHSVQRINFLVTKSWDDFRLQTPRNIGPSRRISLDRRWKDILWIPNLYFVNSVSGSVSSNVDSSMYIALSNRTRLQLLAFISLNIVCSNDFSSYPFDQLDCNLEIVPLSESAETVVLRWNSLSMNRLAEESSKYRITYWKETECSENPMKGSSCIKASLKLVRRIGGHLISHFLPTILAVGLSFGGFWIPMTAYSARIIIIVLSFTILSIRQSITVMSFPQTGLWAINVWYTLCTLTIFACLVEYITAINESLYAKPGETTSPSWLSSKFTELQPKILKELLKPTDSNNMADMISRLAFPSIFFIITFLYLLVFAI
ncbi:glycine receptor subunit alpha-2 [Tetranychus urticae]|uniref:Neurotransmitter-gated ion-channel ligand-binding domain-containing protein n=1 Tax=Tetranychus urticae TaxID=32264 RepID=T1KMN7_TETUR|nr:glycine receptor subunit alpha-2 [Tetranychus urticae]